MTYTATISERLRESHFCQLEIMLKIWQMGGINLTFVLN